ncbi:MAG: hypothetical protein CMB64_04910 [Euryarchaeota archaeon]|nr:hypothetical protein [Euryarchaeota archaeon]
MVEISSQYLVYSVPVISAVANFIYLKYINKNQLDMTVIGISCAICLLAYVFMYLYGCTSVSADSNAENEGELKRLKQENAGLKSNLMKIHREVMPMKSAAPAHRPPPKNPMPMTQPQQMQGPPPPQSQMKTKKIEDLSEGKVFSEAENAKPFET